MIIYRTEILGTAMNNVQDIIVKCSEIIRCDSIHHLRLPYRNLIFEQLSPLKRGILVLKTIENILYLWDEAYPNDGYCKELYNDCISFLEGDMCRSEFGDALKCNKTKFDNTLETGIFSASYVGFALYQAGYEILNDNFIREESSDEFSEAPELWSSLFFASLAYNGGADDFDNISAERNKVFWNDFLKNFEQTADNKFVPNMAKYIITADEDVEVCKRKQEIMAESPDSSVNLYLRDLSGLYFKKYFSHDTEKIILRFYFVDNKITVTGYTENIDGDTSLIGNSDIAIYSMGFNFSEKLSDIKRTMYSYKPEEGAWLMFDLTVESDGGFKVEFNYDNYDSFFRTNITCENFRNEMKKFPRQSRFVPYWLAQILSA